MAVHSYDDLKPHIGHKIVCVCYGDMSKSGNNICVDPDNIAIECEDCSMVLVDYERGETDWNKP